MRVVLQGVSFGIAPGQRIVVVGRSGSGKSTLLRVLNRLDEPISGSVLYRGAPLSTLRPVVLRTKVGLLMQRPVVFGGSVRDEFRVRPHGTPPPGDDRLAALLTEVGLDGAFLDRPANALSVGEQQRVCLARALALEPDALLLDEPTSALDPRSLAEVADLLVRLSDSRRLALVVATHQPELVRRLAGDVVLLEEGTARPGASTTQVAEFLEGA